MRAERALRPAYLAPYRGRRTWETPRVPRLRPRQSGDTSSWRSDFLGRTAGNLGESRADRGLLGCAERLGGRAAWSDAHGAGEGRVQGCPCGRAPA
ncbi:hypothetical protein NDU88_000731 [Pleurodeles waltl]|uniref:Uncharacterized protein n=1 Tax=Pleurodeles waltl TaxID=8319 RepID=A0AAV7N8S8_PLEWA|nr:hypothetical protein NDU88_000731 [Pleurodeles waltl]